MIKFLIVLLAISLTLIPLFASAGSKDSGDGSYNLETQEQKSESTDLKSMGCEPFPSCAHYVEQEDELSLTESDLDKKNTKSIRKSQSVI